MFKVQTPDAKKPFPKYLMDPQSRRLISEMEARGLRVEVLNPAVRSIEVPVTRSDGSTHCELGRPEELAEAIQRAAEQCG